MKPPYPSLTAEWHNAPYPAIDPSRPELSQAGKHVAITGGGTGVGAATALAFAAAGAATISVIGRRVEKLQETEHKIASTFPKTAVRIFVSDTTDIQSMKKAAASVGQWDVLIINAGRTMKPTSISDADPEDWWNVYETNVKGSFVTAHTFLPTRNPAGSFVLATTAAIINLPAVYPPCHGASAYISSKLATVRLLDHIGAENPDVFTLAIHPGIVESALMYEGAMAEGNMEASLLDDSALGGNFMVWATSAEAAFLKGKWVWSNWDVEQLKQRAEEIQTSGLLTPNILGWPFTLKE